jgi:hypothetical protein
MCGAASMLSMHFALSTYLQVPKVGRRFVTPDDIAFIDEMEYAPKTQTAPPFHMKIKSLLPLLGDRVRAPVLRNPYTNMLVMASGDVRQHSALKAGWLL